MFKKSSTQLSMRVIADRVKSGKIRFDNIAQRGPVWNSEKKILFIHSVMLHYPIPVMFGVKLDRNIISVLDR